MTTDQPQAYRAALAHLRPRLAIAGGMSAVINLLMLTGSIYMLQIYDRVLSSGSMPTLLGLFAIVIVLHVFLGWFDFLRARYLGRAAIRLDRLTGDRTFGAWLQSGTGKAAGSGSQPMRDLETLRHFLGGPAITALFDAPWAPIYLVVLFLIHPWLGWLTLGGALVVAVLAFLTRQLSARAITTSGTLDTEARAFAERSRRGAEGFVPMGMEAALQGRWRALHDRALAAAQSGSDPAEGIAAVSRAFRLLLQSSILTLGAWLVLQNAISAGMIVAASILSGRALAPVDQAIGQWRSIGRAITAHRDLLAFFDRQPAQPTRIALPRPEGGLALLGLEKRAATGPDGAPGRKILEDISLQLSAGDGLGVIGQSASGKSSLARLVVGADRPDEGEVRLDGATLDQWAPAVLGRAVGYLPQQVVLLPGTIGENIARFDPDIPDATVIEAARLVGVHEMILQFPQGYATRIGAGPEEVQLSGGQVQRIGLARAVLGSPHLLVLDEPNSNLDMAGDEALTRAIKALRAAGSVVVVIAHRPGALAALNKVAILRDGRLAAFGPKEEVLASSLHQTPASALGPAADLRAPAPRPTHQVVRPLTRLQSGIPADAHPENEARETAAEAVPGKTSAAVFASARSRLFSPRKAGNERTGA